MSLCISCPDPSYLSPRLLPAPPPSFLWSYSLLPSLEMPILPITTITALQETIVAFQRRLAETLLSPSPRIDASTTLLPYCTTRPPLSGHTHDVLLQTYHSIAELAEAATTGDGQEGLRRLVGAAAETAIEFWRAEYLVE